MTLSILFLLAFLLHRSSTTFGRFNVEKNSISVLAPESISGKHDSAIGNFGAPDYGGSMILDVKLPEKGADGCKPLGTSFKRINAKANPSVALLYRGGCYFALKVWHAQNAGAASVIVADDRVEPLITMDTPQKDKDAAKYLQNITIPSALIEKALGDKLKAELAKKQTVTVKLDWSESLPHPDERVEYEFWTNSNDECGPKCDAQIEFMKSFKGAAQLLEKGGYTTFTPHYITWYCPVAFTKSRRCKSQCINHGRYCAPDPEQDFSKGYDGKDVVLENLRQLCVHKDAKESKKSWVWWDYVTDFHILCSMKGKKYNKECAEKVIESLGVSVSKVRDCMGNPDADEDNILLKAEQAAQIGQGTRGDVTILPTLVINDRQYRGKLDKDAVLKAVCAGFKESTEPPVCLSKDLETNECLTHNGGCWEDKAANVTACKDTFRGRVCECPTVQDIQFQGDGYAYCEAVGPAHCKINNGNCWMESRDGKTFSACQAIHLKGCDCPPGFQGNGRKSCIDIDECREKTACQCADCNCKNKWGGYDCTCKGGLFYLKDQDICIGKGTTLTSGILGILALVAIFVIMVAGYSLYKYRIQSYMDSEICAIMAQYMPLDNQSDVHHALRDDA